MSMMEWAKKEVELACKKENPNRKESEFDYGCACYESALKAFNSLMEDGHSGFSISLTKDILNRLLLRKPLTPIENTNDIWKFSAEYDDKIAYRCIRMSSLFKYEYFDGNVSYMDNDRFYAVLVDDPECYFSSNMVNEVMLEFYPIKFPYIPYNNLIKVFCDMFSRFNTQSRKFDTFGLLYCIDPESGLKREINKFFKFENGKRIEIGYYEFICRKNKSNKKPLNLSTEETSYEKSR